MYIAWYYIQSNLCITTTLGTFQNGLNRQMVVLFRLGLDHSFTYVNKYNIITIDSIISIENVLSIKLSNSKYNCCCILSKQEKIIIEF